MQTEISTLFNATIASAAIAAAFKLGLLDEIGRRGHIELATFCDQKGIDEGSLGTLIAALRQFEIVEPHRQPGRFRPGPAFAEAHANQGYFHWLIAGYGPMLQNLAEAIREGGLPASTRLRDPAAISLAAGDYGARFVNPVLDEVLSEAHFELAADVGCGGAARLLHLASSRPGFRGLGIELDTDLVRRANAAIAEAGLDGRIRVVEGDIRNLAPAPELAEVDLVLSFFMAHDLWPRSDCVAALRRIRETFPAARRFLLCDTYRSEALDGAPLPVFTLGFELTHAVLRQYLPTASEWREVFAEAGWECRRRHEVGIPHSAIFDLRWSG